jgi:Transposase, Mutator family
MPDSMEPGGRVTERWSRGECCYGGFAKPTRNTEDPMTDDRMALVELLQKSGEADFLRGVAEAVLQILMEADVEGVIGAGRHERTGDRLTYRNGYRDRTLDTRLPLILRIPKLRQGSYFPPFLEPRKTAERALVMVIQEAWIGGVSTRRVDELVQAMGLSGISKSQVSKLCKDIDERVAPSSTDRSTGSRPGLMASDLEVGCSTPTSFDNAGAHVSVFFVVVPNGANELCSFIVSIIRVSCGKAAIQVDICRIVASVTYADCVRILREAWCTAQCQPRAHEAKQQHFAKVLRIHLLSPNSNRCKHFAFASHQKGV